MTAWSSMVTSAESSGRLRMQARLEELKTKSEIRCTDMQSKHEAFMLRGDNDAHDAHGTEEKRRDLKSSVK